MPELLLLTPYTHSHGLSCVYIAAHGAASFLHFTVACTAVVKIRTHCIYLLLYLSFFVYWGWDDGYCLLLVKQTQL